MEFGVEIGEYRGVVRVPRRVFQRLPPEPPTPRVRRGVLPPADPVREHGQRKLYRPQLTEDGNVEISGRDLRGASQGERSLDSPLRGKARCREFLRLPTVDVLLNR